MTPAQKLEHSARNRRLYSRDIEANRARSRLRKQGILLQRAIEAARVELSAMPARAEG